MASSSKSRPSKAKSQCLMKQETRDWLALPSDVMAKILSTLDVSDILENAQKVCTLWYKICKDPAIWRVIRMESYLKPHENPRTCRYDPYELRRKMYKDAVDRSQGQLVDVTFVGFDDGQLLQYVAHRASQLKHLEFERCFITGYDGWAEVLKKFPLLEELCLDSTPISKEALEAAGGCCPLLKTLKVYLPAGDETAIAIRENLSGLRHLELSGYDMTNIGLQAILDGCGHLESLDLSKCHKIDLNGDLGKRCFEQIKCLKPPLDLGDDYDDYYDFCGCDCDCGFDDFNAGNGGYDSEYEDYLLMIGAI